MKKFNLLSGVMMGLLAALGVSYDPLMGVASTVGRRSRGTKQFGARHHTSTDWLHIAPHGGGDREVARRQRQLAAGTLKVN